jgi:hypothetical protein
VSLYLWMARYLVRVSDSGRGRVSAPTERQLEVDLIFYLLWAIDTHKQVYCQQSAQFHKQRTIATCCFVLFCANPTTCPLWTSWSPLLVMAKVFRHVLVLSEDGYEYKVKHVAAVLY